MDGKSLNITEEKRNQLKEIIPEAFTEGKIDWEKLKATLGEDLEFKNERYVLNWAGKSDAFWVLQSPTTSTLVPDKEESVNFDDTENIFIEGENLEVLKVLQKSYFGKIKMIYIDPPYNTGNDKFIYPDKFSETKEEYLSRIGDKDETGYMTREGLFRKNNKDSGHYHSNWLSMMYPRLFLARNLLRKEGVIFVSIDDNEVHNLRLMMNEVFGEENFLAQVIWDLKTGRQAGHFTKSHEYLVVFARDKDILGNFNAIETGNIVHGALKKISKANPASEIEFPAGIDFEGKDAVFTGVLGGSEKEYILSNEMVFKDGKLHKPVVLKAGWAMRNQVINWINGEETYDTKGQKVIMFYFNSQGILFYEKERGKYNPKTVWTGLATTKQGTDELASIMGVENLIEFPKSINLIKHLINFITIGEKRPIVLDFFAGTCPTAHAVLDLNKEDGGNRKFIMVQLPEKCDEESEAFKAGYETIAEIGKERIRRVIKKIKAEQQSKLDVDDTTDKQDLGFKVFKLQQSNFKIWRSDVKTEEELVTQLTLHTDPVDENAKIKNILYELLLKSGVPLTARIEEKGGYYQVNDGEIALMLEKVNESIIKKVIAENPNKVITLDKLFNNNDQLKTNTALQMKDAGIEFKAV
ncbi:MAG TPA: site-specific DNA-methyltransferase [Methanophagales archaeon]|nr:site-specific DNA-methyltransferase [Methanophagales archaeon]